MQKYPDQFVDNAAIHREIRTILAAFIEPSRSRMRAKIRHDRAALRNHGTAQADANARHTYREFVIGFHLQRHGLSPEYNCPIAGKTPDWYDNRRRLLLETFTCERGGASAVTERVSSRIAEKVRNYSDVVRQNELSFIVAVYGDRLSGLAAADCERAIADANLFIHHAELSGVVFFTEQSDETSIGRYAYRYFPNPQSDRPIDLPI